MLELTQNMWLGSGKVIGQSNGSNWQFEIAEVSSQSRVYKQYLHQFFREFMPITPLNGEFEVEIKIFLNPNFPQIDVDNVAKAVLDGLKGHVFVDDSQIMRLVVEKLYAECEKLEISVARRNT
ncbi:MAG: endodeoxyribonuclease RusA [Hyphomonadaceae bacterium]|nr:MAG: endodeoxyribonuclease RusA [Hyphomonadaceae bacterium]